MGNAATKAKNKYNDSNYDRISLFVPKGEKDNLKQFIAETQCAESMNQFIVDAIAGHKKRIAGSTK